MKTKKGKEALSPWYVEQMRLTAFTPVGQGEHADAWWEAAVGEPPETKTVKFKGVTQTIEGRLGPGRLVLNVDLNRVDWVTAAVVNVDQDLDGIPNIGEFEQVKEAFGSLIAKWLSSAPPVTRLAWGTVLIRSVENRIEGYRAMQTYLQALDVDPDGSSDLLYQINRPRESKVVRRLTINRLQKWSVLALHRMSVQLVPAPTTQETRGQVSPAFSACRLELDINTQAERSEPLPAKELKRIYTELASLGQEIAMRGDVA